MLPNRCHFHSKMPKNGVVMRFSLRNSSFPLDFRFFNHRDFHCFFVILLSTFCIFHRGDFISRSFCTQNVLTKDLLFPFFNFFTKLCFFRCSPTFSRSNSFAMINCMSRSNINFNTSTNKRICNHF